MASTKPLEIEMEDLLIDSFLDHSGLRRSSIEFAAYTRQVIFHRDSVPNNDTVDKMIFLDP